MKVVTIAVASEKVYPWGGYRYGKELIFNSNNVKATVAIAIGWTGMIIFTVLILTVTLFMWATTIHVAC